MPLRRGAVPLYYQLERVLRKRILSGDIEPSRPIPTERELCREFGVSRTTVRQALMILESEGLIVRRQGKGTFVKPRVRSGGPFELYGYVDDLFSLGATTRLELKKRELLPAPEEVASDMGVRKGEEVCYFLGVRHMNQQDLALFEAYVPKDIGLRIPLGRLDYPFLIAEVEHVAVENVRRAHQMAYADVATERHESIINVPRGSPLLIIKMVYLTSRNETLEVAVTHFPAHTYQFFAKLERVGP
jgi:GntR family transcriptional regulator